MKVSKTEINRIYLFNFYFAIAKSARAGGDVSDGRLAVIVSRTRNLKFTFCDIGCRVDINIGLYLMINSLNN